MLALHPLSTTQDSTTQRLHEAQRRVASSDGRGRSWFWRARVKVLKFINARYGNRCPVPRPKVHARCEPVVAAQATGTRLSRQAIRGLIRSIAASNNHRGRNA
ncbi:MAG: hypothetical protein AAF581_09655 [Planctomycetota bacterium]